MKLKQFLSLFIGIILVLGLTSCTKEVSYIDDERDKSPLSIYLIEHVDHDLNDNIEYYGRVKPKDKREIEITWFKYEEIEDMYKRLSNELSLGKGPDIIVINSRTDKYVDIIRMAETNAFADMEILIENSESFDFDNYNKTALDAGIIHKKRVFFPLTYKVEYIIGVEECFQNNNLEIPNELTINNYCDLLGEYYEKIPNKPALLGIDPILLLSELIEVGKPIEKTDQLKNLFQLLKIESKRYVEIKKKTFTNKDIYEYYGKYIGNNNLYLKPKNIGWNQFRQMHAHYNIIENMYDSHIIVFNQPVHENSPIKSYTENGLAININSKHKNEAFEFLQFMLSEGTQSRTISTIDLPINKEAYKTEVKNFFNGYEGVLSSMFEINETKIPETMKKDYVEYIDSAEICKYIGQFRYVYHNIINQCIEDYYNDQMTFDEMIDEINNKLAIYYSE